jgi:hypothetical protein
MTVSTTTTAIDSQPVFEYEGVVTGEAVLGANVFRDWFAGLREANLSPACAHRCWTGAMLTSKSAGLLGN